MLCEFHGAVGNDIGPSLGFIAVQDVPLGSWETSGGADGNVKTRPVLARHHQYAVGEQDERGWVEIERRTQHDPGETVGMQRRKLGNVARDLRRNMRATEPEMVE